MEHQPSDGPPLPCQPQFIRRTDITRSPHPRGTKVVRVVHFIDRRGSQDVKVDSWIEPA